MDTRLAVDSAGRGARDATENNSIGTLNILAACSDAGSPVRKLVFKSSAHYYGCGPKDPAFFTEEMRRDHAPATPLKRSIVEAEASVGDFADKHPRRHGHDAALLQRARAGHRHVARASACRCRPCR